MTLELLDLWALPLAEQQRLRTYRPWGEEQLKRENAAPDFPKVGPFYVLKEQRSGATLIVDPRRPWNDATVHRDQDEAAARAWAKANGARGESTSSAAPKGPGSRTGEATEEAKLSPKAEIGNFDPWGDVEEIPT